MSQWALQYQESDPSIEQAAFDGVVDAPPRSLAQPLLMLIPLGLSMVSWMAGGLALLTDLAFVILTFLAVSFVLAELFHFSHRFGIGGLVLWGGVITWFCYDYLCHWLGASFPHWDMPFSQETVAKAAAMHMLYITCMAIGLRLRVGRWAVRRIAALGGSANPRSLFPVMLLTQVLGLGAYVLFTSEPFYTAIYHQITAGRTGMGVAWTVGRTGNLNYSWTAYVAQLLQIGEGGAILAAFCMVFLEQGFMRNLVCFFVWLLWLMMGFGTGTRGEIVFFMLPMVCFLFIRYHVLASQYFHRYSRRAYVIVIAAIVVAVIMVQVQIRFRGVGFSDVDLNDVSLVHLEGNTMFSEGLLGFSLIPQHRNYFYDNFPGCNFLLPIPNILFWAAIHPIPRALWNAKPVDPTWSWYNSVATGGSGTAKTEGTTVSTGVVGYWFFRFGPVGVIEGGLFIGWILAMCERVLYNNRGRPLAVLAALGMATWIFRGFRNLGLQDLYQFVIGLIAIVAMVYLVAPFTAPQPLPADD